MDNIQDAPYVINSEDKQGLIVVITTFCLICVWILFCIRGYIRKKNGPWKWDDTCVAIATVLTTVRSAIVYLEIHRGYGKSGALLSEGAPASIGKAVYGDNVLYFIAMFFSKCAVLLLCQRMTPKKEHLIAIIAIFTSALLWALSSIMLISISCNPGHPWVDLASQCTGIATRWKVICALDIVTEVAIFGCSIYLVYGLHMSVSLKSIVVLAFAIRLPTTIFSGVHLSTLLREITSSDPTLAGAITAAWKQLELDFAICACTFSSLGAFLKPFDKELGPSRSATNPPYGNGSDQQSYQMNSLASGNHNTITGGNEVGSKHAHGHAKKNGNGNGNGGSSSTSTSINLPILRPDQQATIATTAFPSTGSASDRMSVESNDSKKGIIMKHTMWTVDTSRNSDIEGSRNHK